MIAERRSASGPRSVAQSNSHMELPYRTASGTTPPEYWPYSMRTEPTSITPRALSSRANRTSLVNGTDCFGYLTPPIADSKSPKLRPSREQVATGTVEAGSEYPRFCFPTPTLKRQGAPSKRLSSSLRRSSRRFESCT